MCVEVVATSACDHLILGDVRCDPLPDVAGQVIDTEGRSAGGMATDFVGTERRWLFVIGNVDVRVVAGELVSMRETPI
jgi:hypothetical protein